MDTDHEALESIRYRLDHEDNLVNQRLSWILTSQAFLLTGYAILLKHLRYPIPEMGWIGVKDRRLTPRTPAT